MVQGERPSRITDVAHLRSACSAHSAGTTVSPMSDGLPDWTIEDGRLRNTRADYFSIGLYAPNEGRPILLIEQKEKALVMLLTAEIDGRDAVLLNLRTEPGLIGLTNLSTTIQSTPSNYLRRHGGKGTPFIDIADDPRSHGVVVYEGEHHDWGDHYLDKTKRFLIVKLAAPVESPPGFCWVDLVAARASLLENNLVTNDLRVSIPLVGTAYHRTETHSGAVPPADGGTPPHGPEYFPGVIDSRGTAVSFFRTQTETREVRSWVQPLLVPRNPLEISLAFARSASRRLFAVQRRTQPGLLGRQLWFPAKAGSGRIVRAVSTSAEGGRFWRYGIDIRVVEVGLSGEPVGSADGDVTWMPDDELAELVARSLQTSLELRMAWSLVHAEDWCVA